MDIKITVNVNIPAIADLAETLNEIFGKHNVVNKTDLINSIADAVKNDRTEDVAEKEAAKADTPKDDSPKVTEVDLRAKFVELSKKNKKSELKELLTSFGVEKVSDLKPAQFNDAWSKLEAM